MEILTEEHKTLLIQMLEICPKKKSPKNMAVVMSGNPKLHFYLELETLGLIESRDCKTEGIHIFRVSRQGQIVALEESKLRLDQQYDKHQ